MSLKDEIKPISIHPVNKSNTKTAYQSPHSDHILLKHKALSFISDHIQSRLEKMARYGWWMNDGREDGWVSGWRDT